MKWRRRVSEDNVESFLRDFRTHTSINTSSTRHAVVDVSFSCYCIERFRLLAEQMYVSVSIVRLASFKCYLVIFS